MINNYYKLTKPGIIYGNAITTIAGFFLASQGRVDFKLLLAALLGISLVIASGCVFNNYIDRHIDALMERTKNRALVTGAVSNRSAIIFGTILGIIGFSTLYLRTNTLTAFVAFIGFFFYVVLYGWTKRISTLGTLVGAVSGAMPLVVGYTAVANRFDAGAVILFLILFFWQMPHFYAIAIYRLEEYKAASIPVLPLKQGIRATKIHMLIYIAAFIFASASLTYYRYTGYLYLVVAMALGLAWLWKAIGGFKAVDNNKWARKIFKFSLIVLTSLCVIISIDAMLR
jgi:protoheme IX farnesyltransferase